MTEYMKTSWKIIIITLFTLLITTTAGASILLTYQGRELPYVGRIVTVPFIEQKPENVIHSMQSTMANLPLARYNISIDISSVPEKDSWAVQSDIEAAGSMSDTGNGIASMRSAIQIGGMSFVASLEFRIVDGIHYFRFSEVPAIPFIDLQSVYGTWYTCGSDTKFQHDENSIDASLVDALVNQPYLDSVERLPDETVDGKRMYRYSVKLHAAAIETAKRSLREMLPFSGWNATAAPNAVDFNPIELWIGKEDSVLYRAQGSAVSKSTNISFELLTSHLNEAVLIEIPASSVPVSTFGKDFFGGTNVLDIPLFGYLVGIDTEALIEDTDNDTLYKIWENAFGTDVAEPDTDGDGFLDGEEVRSGYDPLGEGSLF
ncbi:MAG: thrombospondin type 3 repeat-containing protein [Patescibacteria group bacterium]